MGKSGFRERLHEDIFCLFPWWCGSAVGEGHQECSNRTSCLFLIGHISMFLTSLAAFQMMNVNPCISTVSVAAAEEREELRSWTAKICLFLPLRYRSWGKSKLLLLYLSPASWGFPAFSERCSGGRCSRFPSCWWKEEKKAPNSRTQGLCWLWFPVGVGGSSVQGCVLLPIPVCRTSWYRLLGRHWETPR